MNGLHVVYAVALIIALLQWGFNRFLLARGLSAEFYKIRMHDQFKYRFEQILTGYIAHMVGLLIQVMFIWFSAMRLLSAYGLFSLESAIVLSVISLFFLKDRFYYESAIFAVSRWRKE